MQMHVLLNLIELKIYMKGQYIQWMFH